MHMCIYFIKLYNANDEIYICEHKYQLIPALLEHYPISMPKIPTNPQNQLNSSLSVKTGCKQRCSNHIFTQTNTCMYHQTPRHYL